jgi:hypothetical protein
MKCLLTTPDFKRVLVAVFAADVVIGWWYPCLRNKPITRGKTHPANHGRSQEFTKTFSGAKFSSKLVSAWVTTWAGKHKDIHADP